MKKLLTAFLFLFCSYQNAYTQNNKVYDMTEVDQQADFVGGMSKFYKFLSVSIHLPANMEDSYLSIRLILSFIVEKTAALKMPRQKKVNTQKLKQQS